MAAMCLPLAGPATGNKTGRTKRSEAQQNWVLLAKLQDKAEQAFIHRDARLIPSTFFLR